MKITGGLLVNGTVAAADDAGLWIKLVSTAAPPGVPEGIQSAVLFTPFAQILWLVTSLGTSEHPKTPEI